MPAISIITSAYNYARYLTDCIASVRAQTFTDWEHIIVDPASTDNTRDVIAKAVASDPRVLGIELRKRNGLCTARNRAVTAAMSDYVMNLDADDKLDPTALEKMVKLAAPDRLVTSGLHAFADTTLPQLLHSILLKSGDVIPPLVLGHNDLRRGNYLNCHTIFYRAAFDKAGRYDPYLDELGCEDWDLWLRLSMHSTIMVVAEPLLQYRVHAESHTARITAVQQQQRMSYIARKYGL